MKTGRSQETARRKVTPARLPPAIARLRDAASTRINGCRKLGRRLCSSLRCLSWSSRRQGVISVTLARMIAASGHASRGGLNLKGAVMVAKDDGSTTAAHETTDLQPARTALGAMWAGLFG